MTKEPLYIISDDMIRQWRGACVKVPPFQEVDQCKDCEYRGKGARKGCCDFDDNAMEKIFRSRPLEQEKQAAVNAVLEKIDNLDCEKCKLWHTSECPVWCGGSPRACIDHTKIPKPRKRSVDRNSEYKIQQDERRKIRLETIWEILKHFKFNCPGGQINPICDLCGAAMYCEELRQQTGQTSAEQQRGREE